MTLPGALLLVAFAAPPDFHLQMNRGACYGSCPIYTLTIDGRGGVVFDGEADTAVVGPHSRTMTTDALEQLVSELRRIDFFSLGDYSLRSTECVQHWTDHPSVSITLRMDGREKTVHHYLGCRGFALEERLIALEMRVDALAGVEPWKKRDPRIGQRRMIAQMFGDGCQSGVACENAAAAIAADALVLFHIDQRSLRIDRDGSMKLTTGKYAARQHFRGKLSSSELQRVRDALASKRAPAAKDEPYVTMVIPANGELPIVNAPIGSVPGARFLLKLIKERPWAS